MYFHKEDTASAWHSAVSCIFSTTRNVLTFVNTATIAWCQDPGKKAEFFGIMQ